MLKIPTFLFVFTTLIAFANFHAQAELKPDTVAMVTRPLPPTGGVKSLTIASWNVKHLGRNSFDFSTARLLDSADIVTFQEVNAGISGQSALQQLAAGMNARTGEKICMGLSEIPTDAQERYAYLWKDKRVAYVKADGQIMGTCPASAITLRLGVRHADEIAREPAFGTFYFRPVAQQFVFASIHLRPSGKKPQLEVPPLFSTFEAIRIPLIIAGDYNLDSTHSAFQDALTMGFQPAMRGVKTSLKMKKRELNKPYDNFWYRQISMTRASVLDLYRIFPEMDARAIYNDISDHSPIVGEFIFLE
jgi:hypothetical protein